MLQETTKECVTVEYEIRVEYDHGARPSDYDCYTPKQVEAFRNEEWRFVYVSPTVRITEGDFLTTITVEGPGVGGVEYGEVPRTDLPPYDAEANLRQIALEQMYECEQTLRRFSLRVEDLPAPTFRWGV